MRIDVRRLRLSPAAIGSAALVALLLLGTSGFGAAAATTMAPRCDSTNVRTGPATTYAKKASLSTTARVTVVATVSGGSYGTTCNGTWLSGSSWYRINTVNGKAVSSLYGVSYVYGASKLFKTVTVSPTAAPSVTPGASASAAPVAGASPSAPPASLPPPSAAPSSAPSVAPSVAPSTAPSSAPSTSPAPTVTPSPTPTGPTVLPDTIVFYGRGYGHGVGMSQYGAYGRAVAGQTAPTILAHYYPGTALGTMANATVRVLVLSAFPAPSSSPLRIYGRIGAWSIDGVAGTFPADAQLRFFRDTSTASGWRITVIGADTSTLANLPAPSAAFYVCPATASSLLQLYSKPTSYDRFRGTLRVIGRTDGTVNVVNWLPMELYLRGVVPVEMSSSWPAEALKAQAVAARSYADYRLHPSSGSYDVYDDTRSQVYRGYLAEKSNTTNAINATAGQIVTSGGAVANTLFHSADGGATENNQFVFVSATGAITSGKVSYLQGSSDRAPDGTSYDRTSPFATWHTTIYALPQIQAIFAADSRTNVGLVVALDLRNRGPSGRLISVTLIGANGTTKTVSGGVFVAIFNARTPATDPAMRNTLFDLAPIP
ncbi:MAG TPA: SpoIID/LytB domain-containing protein [Candidatus Acidoferrales bacterium]|nr:SpoIID/LytB domain-containing protein [Candidatus Acidoferrales bacterium]